MQNAMSDECKPVVPQAQISEIKEGLLTYPILSRLPNGQKHQWHYAKEQKRDLQQRVLSRILTVFREAQNMCLSLFLDAKLINFLIVHLN